MFPVLNVLLFPHWFQQFSLLAKLQNTFSRALTRHNLAAHNELKADRILEKTDTAQTLDRSHSLLSQKKTERLWKFERNLWCRNTVDQNRYTWRGMGGHCSCRLVSKSGLTLASLHRPITKPNCNYTLIWQSMKEGADSNRFRQNYEEVFCTKGNGTKSLRVTIHCTGRVKSTGRMKSTQKVIVLLNLSTSRFLVRWKSIFVIWKKGALVWIWRQHNQIIKFIKIQKYIVTLVSSQTVQLPD